MIRYIGKRLLYLIPILLGITFITFGLMYLSPSDPAEMMLQVQGVAVDPQVLANVRAEMGLDKPFLAQYLTWLGNLLRGDLGVSYASGVPVIQKLLGGLTATVALAVSSVLLTVLVSIPLGILAAVKQNKLTDAVIRGCTFVGTAIPGFFLSLLLIYVFALKLKWLPVLASGTLKGLILPTVTLSVAMTCKYIRQIRAIILEELNKEYVTGARSRGIRERTILYKNVLKNAMLTIVTLIGLSIGSLLGGTAIVETIFVWPGLGKLVVDAINFRDYPVIQGFVVWIATIFVVVNLATDISYRLLDPRIKLDKGGA